MASNGKAVTGTAVMARSANEEKKKPLRCLVFGLGVVGVALLVFCLVAVGFVFFCVLLLCVSA